MINPPQCPDHLTPYNDIWATDYDGVSWLLDDDGAWRKYGRIPCSECPCPSECRAGVICCIQDIPGRKVA